MEADKFKISLQDTNQIKAIAILFVIAGHLGITRIGMWESGSWGVALFLTISGYGIHESYYKDGLKNFVPKRLSKVYLPYIIVMISELLIDYFYLKKSYKPVQIFGVFLGRGEILDGTMWYIFYLLLFYAAFWVIYKIVKRDSYVCIGALAVFGMCLAVLWVAGIYHTPVLSGIYFPFFALGCLLSKLSTESVVYREFAGSLIKNNKAYGGGGIVDRNHSSAPLYM